jgi:ubiquitin-associated SH3 domain-containing protein
MGWNGAHNSFPHITLTSSFKCPDADVTNLTQTVSEVSEHFMEDISTTKLLLERYMSPNFFGLFVEKEQEGLLKRLTQELCKEIRKLGVKADPIIKSFHLTLAYQFPQKHFTPLEDLAREITVPSSPSGAWELRLYSYDSRTAGCDVYKVLYAHVAREPDELELLIGDFVFVTQEEVAKTTDGWVVGISWLTGATGYLPTNYVERTAETNAWTLHTVFPFSREAAEGQAGGEGEGPGSLERLVDSQREAEGGPGRAEDLEVESLYARVVRHSPAGGGEVGREEDCEVTSTYTPRPQVGEAGQNAS